MRLGIVRKRSQPVIVISIGTNEMVSTIVKTARCNSVRPKFASSCSYCLAIDTSMTTPSPAAHVRDTRTCVLILWSTCGETGVARSS